jgi:uridine phosphorylase
MKSEIVVNDGKAYHIGVRSHEIAPNIFQVGDPARAYKVAKRFDNIEFECKNREFVTLTGTLDGIPVTVMGTGIGHDNVEIALLEAYTLLCFDLKSKILKNILPDVNIIRIGTSGGSQADIDPGTLGITNYSIGLDSTGIYWEVAVPDKTAANLENELRRLINDGMDEKSRFKGSIFPYASKATTEIVETLEIVGKELFPQFQQAVGVTVASPGFYGASSRYIEGLELSVPGIKDVCAELFVDGHRIINFEMESSLIFHLSQGLGWKAGTICPIISNSKKQDSILDYSPFVEAAIDIAVEAMKRIIK